jgi:hypothetical protein
MDGQGELIAFPFGATYTPAPTGGWNSVACCPSKLASVTVAVSAYNGGEGATREGPPAKARVPSDEPAGVAVVSRTSTRSVRLEPVDVSFKDRAAPVESSDEVPASMHASSEQPVGTRT